MTPGPKHPLVCFKSRSAEKCPQILFSVGVAWEVRVPASVPGGDIGCGSGLFLAHWARTHCTVCVLPVRHFAHGLLALGMAIAVPSAMCQINSPGTLREG